MSILNQMGIQQWRLRPVANSSVADLVAAESEHVSDGVNSADKGAGSSVVSTAPPGLVGELDPVAEERPTSLALKSSTPDLQIKTPDPSPQPDTPVAAAAAPMAATLPAESIDPIATLDWQGLQALVDGQDQCATCGLGRSLLGAGDPNANWLFVVDAPHRQDIQAQQFLAARAGQLFEAMLSSVGLERSSIYLTSVFKCVASDDLSSVPNCDKILHRQIELVQPHVVIALGEFAAQSVIKANESLAVLRASEQICFRTKVPIVPIYTLAEMLDEPALKSLVWQDLKRCLSISAAHA